MILSRIRKALTDQNWLSVGIEFVIVVAGVMLAFQVTAWNERRQDDARVGQALAQLQLESEQTIQALRGRIEADAERQAERTLMVRVATTGELAEEDRDSFDRAIAQLMYFSLPPIRQNTYAALEQAGDLALISDPGLIIELTRYQGRVGWIESQHDSFRRGLTEFTDRLSRFIVHLPTEDPRVTRVEVDLERLRSDPSLVSALVQIARMQAIFAHYVVQLEAHTVELCHRLSEETGRACDTGDTE
ncbi:hypothetical protein [Maricaulis parjimensis]|uniref:hypothetical protein n=1 Tax=Maricaulis parjimensis TaxID=144023 RepID=UPI001939746C|nr:hypothetical protein [Maricaulis parjimensis]